MDHEIVEDVVQEVVNEVVQEVVGDNTHLLENTIPVQGDFDGKAVDIGSIVGNVDLTGVGIADIPNIEYDVAGVYSAAMPDIDYNAASQVHIPEVILVSDGLPVPPVDLEKYYGTTADEALDALKQADEDLAFCNQYKNTKATANGAYIPACDESKRIAKEIGITPLEVLIISGNFTNFAQIHEHYTGSAHRVRRACEEAAEQKFINFTSHNTFEVTSLGRVVLKRFEDVIANT